MISAKQFRDQKVLSIIPQKSPGWYQWWAKREQLDTILTALEIDYSYVKDCIERKGDLFCIYVGIAVKESLYSRLNWHINDSHKLSRVKSGTLSTLRQSISSIVSRNQSDKEGTNTFIDELFITYYPCNSVIDSEDSKKELNAKEKEYLKEHLCILNIRDNKHDKATQLKKNLRALRKESKQAAINKAEIE